MKKYVLAFGLLSAITVVSCNSETNTDKTTDTEKVADQQNEQKFTDSVQGDTEFAVNAASVSMLEIELGKLAQTNAASKDVKAFGQSMINDHSAANDELKASAAAKNISLPAALPADKQGKVDDLAKKKGKDFDKDYIDMMVSGHKDAVDMFQKEANDGKDPDLKAWAAGKVATIQHHQMMAEDLQKKMK